jgi:hypothetical protein
MWLQADRDSLAPPILSGEQDEASHREERRKEAAVYRDGWNLTSSGLPDDWLFRTLDRASLRKSTAPCFLR